MPSIAPFVASYFIVKYVVNSASFFVIELMDNSFIDPGCPFSLVFIAVVEVEIGSYSIQIV